MNLPSSRIINGLALLICISVMLFAYFYLQKTLLLDPCPLCIMERILVMAMATVFLITALHNPARLGQRIYATLNLLLVIPAIGVAARHIWLQHLPASQVPECGAGLEYMLETMPLLEVFQDVLTGSGECAEIKWTLLGLSIPEQTILLYSGLAIVMLIQLLRKRES